ncbi:MAG: inositol 2-dehydrogenase [Deltaproteobacteria bacterium]|nr:inositol 2-dehydrogenase [Deltaproteobacteria bacterium]
MLEICQLGAGRIGAIHADNVARHPRARLSWVVDVSKDACESLAKKYGARATPSADEALADPKVGAVLIASPTPTHVDLILKAAKAGKAIFCEKPIDLSLSKVEACLAELDQAAVPFFIAFNRRFDASFRKLKAELDLGRIGSLETLAITSRDPRPPPLEYVKVSGGIFRDMMIHDFDTARWILGEEPVEVFASGSCLVDPEIGRAGDVDTAMVTMRTASGKLCHISNSRRAVYGYDQRIEAFGSKGMLQAGNVLESTVTRSGEQGVVAEKPLDFFLERYAGAYQAELDHFVNGVLDKKSLSPSAKDGRMALVLAEAANRSRAEKRPVEVTA